MNYKKGDMIKIIETGETGFYLNKWESENDGTILILGGIGAFTAFVPESEVEYVDATYEEKMLAMLADISQSTKAGYEKTEELFDHLIPKCECCGEPAYAGIAPVENNDCDGCCDGECDCGHCGEKDDPDDKMN
jgi:hypothetical protein